MQSFLAALRHNLGALGQFSGRTSRDQFWPYAGVVLGLLVLSTAILMVNEIAPLLGKMIRFVEAHPDQGRIVRTATSISVQVYGYHPELMPDFERIIGGMALVFAPALAALAAAVARRLHDVGWSGLLGLAPLPFLAFGLWAFKRVAASFEGGPDLGLMMALFANNLVYLASLAGLVVLLTRSGAPEPNRYGPPT